MRFAALFGAVLAALAVAATAFAHAEPATVNPGDGAVLNASPTQIVMEMSQAMARQAGANDIQVFDSSGKQVTTGSATVDDNDRQKLTLVITTPLPQGDYTVKWKTLSADDGDAADGATTFTISTSRPAAPGKTELRDTGIGTPASTAAAQPAALQNANQDDGGGSSGTSWVLVVAVGVAALAIGAGGTFLFVTKSQS